MIATTLTALNKENNKGIHDSNKMIDKNNNNNSSEQSNDGYIDFFIIQMKNCIEHVKNMQAKHQDVFNISDNLQSKDTENKCDVLLELENNTVPAW